MKILITGAHFTPALATIEELKQNYQCEVVYVGRKTTFEGDDAQSVESQVLPKLGVKFISLITGRLQREFTIFTIPSLFKIPIGFVQALFILLREKPDVVLSFGGYVAVPVVIWAWLFSISIIIHEQAIIPGLAHKISAHFADKIAISFPQNNFFDKDKVILTGNPLRSEITEAYSKSPKNEAMPKILIVGGNQGSHVINITVEGCLDKLTRITKVILQTGDSKFRDFERIKQNENENIKVEKFIDKGWGKVLRDCDLVVSRAGINTLTEMAFLGKPALIIPIEGHLEQNKNAKFFESLGSATILPQAKLTSKSLLKNIKMMLNNLANLKDKAKMAEKKIIPDAAKRLALETMLLGKND